jgi:hypothetical protein
LGVWNEIETRTYSTLSKSRDFYIHTRQENGKHARLSSEQPIATVTYAWGGIIFIIVVRSSRPITTPLFHVRLNPSNLPTVKAFNFGLFFQALYSSITYYWTVPIIFDHSYLVGTLTSLKTPDTKVSGF